MAAIRVGFLLGNVGWLGGANYYRNLLSAVSTLPQKDVDLIVFAGTNSNVEMFEKFAEVIRSPIFDRKTLPWYLSKFFSRIFPRRDYVLYNELKKNNINVLSHSGPLWKGCDIKTISWIPDFQHLHLPQFFDENERRSRDNTFMAMANLSDCVILSSETAQRDLQSFCTNSAGRSAVLRFVPEVNLMQEFLSLEELRARYAFEGFYFYLPNQFWKHKNHKVVIQALKLLKEDGCEITVLATGGMEDSRNPDHFSELKAMIGESGLDHNFKILGVIPYGDLLSLMHNSLAVINPSLFEGWSSTVEETKALEKTIILSNLPVHIEQAPRKGVFFDPLNPHDLADKLREISEADHPDAGVSIAHSADYQHMRVEFAKKYVDIVKSLKR